MDGVIIGAVTPKDGTFEVLTADSISTGTGAIGGGVITAATCNSFIAIKIIRGNYGSTDTQ